MTLSRLMSTEVRVPGRGRQRRLGGLTRRELVGALALERVQPNPRRELLDVLERLAVAFTHNPECRLVRNLPASALTTASEVHAK